MRAVALNVPVGTKTGFQLDDETGEYVNLYKQAPVENKTTQKPAKAVKAKGKVAKKAVKGKKAVKKTAVTPKKADKRHTEVLSVLAVLNGKEYSRSEFMTTAEEVLGYSIPFNKKAREVYSSRVAGTSKYTVADAYKA
jgi:hypothetical protein